MPGVRSSGEDLDGELIGVDVGGTKVFAVRLWVPEGSAAPEVVDSVEAASDAGAPGVLDAITDAATTLADRGGPPAAIGLGLAGFVDEAGIVRTAPNAAGLVGLDVGGMVAERLGVPCVIDNDANCVAVAARAALGEGVSDLVAVTLGTGIGGGVIVGGQLVRGGRGYAGEPGHMVVDRNGPICPCGQRGCWERYASGSALSEAIALAVASGRLERTDVPADTGTDLVRAAGLGVSGAVEVLSEFASWVALGVAGLIAVLDPMVVAIGGGLSAMGDALLDAVNHQLATHHAVMVEDRPPRIVLAPGGPAAGAIGAAVLAGQRIGGAPPGA